MSKADETKEALIAALVRLLTTRGIGAISVRDVAAKAGVNHGLVHRYFGSKEGLVREAVSQIGERFYKGSPAAGQTRWIFELLRAHPELPIVIARTCLDGPHDLLGAAAPPGALMKRLLERVEQQLARLGLADRVDGRVINALVTAALLGWFVFQPLLADHYELPADASEQVSGLLGNLDAMMDRAAR